MNNLTWVGPAVLKFMRHVLKKLVHVTNNLVCGMLFVVFAVLSVFCLEVTSRLEQLNNWINKKIGAKSSMDDWMQLFENWWSQE
jgi:hypothetical protein